MLNANNTMHVYISGVNLELTRMFQTSDPHIQILVADLIEEISCLIGTIKC